MVKIHIKKNINFLLKNMKVLALSILAIQKLYDMIWMIWIIFIKILKNTVLNEEGKTLIVFGDMIADMLTNKKLHPIVT